MALDLGLAKKPRAMTNHNRSFAGNQSEGSSPENDVSKESREATQSVMSPEKRLPDSSLIESRRTLLACYVLCTR